SKCTSSSASRNTSKKWIRDFHALQPKAPDLFGLAFPKSESLPHFPHRMDMRDSLKIGITCYPTYGGSGVVATELGLELAERGHDVHFISYAQPIRLDRPTPNIHYHEVEVSRYPLFDYPPYDLALATRMAEVSELYDLDLLHVHYAIPHSVSAMLARQMLAAGPKRRKLPFV